MLIVYSLPMYNLLAAMSSFLPRLNVWYQNILQTQVKALVLRIVREEEKRPKAKGDKGTEDEEEDELLRKPQGCSMVGKRRSAWRQSGYPAPRQRQKSLRGHILMLKCQTENMEGQMSQFSHVDHFDYLIAANMCPTANLVCASWAQRRPCPSQNLQHFVLKRKEIYIF